MTDKRAAQYNRLINYCGVTLGGDHFDAIDEHRICARHCGIAVSNNESLWSSFRLPDIYIHMYTRTHIYKRAYTQSITFIDSSAGKNIF